MTNINTDFFKNSLDAATQEFEKIATDQLNHQTIDELDDGQVSGILASLQKVHTDLQVTLDSLQKIIAASSTANRLSTQAAATSVLSAPQSDKKAAAEHAIATIIDLRNLTSATLKEIKLQQQNKAQHLSLHTGA